MRVASVALRFAWSAKTRTLLLSLLVAVGMSVLLIVTELSRVSSLGLDDAIAQDAGRTGTYTVSITTDLGLEMRDLAARVDAAVKPFAAAPPRMIEVLATVKPECPPYDALGQQPILVLRDMSARPVGLPFGTGLPSDTRLCLGGQEIPASALYLPTSAEQRTWASGLFVQAQYADVARLTSTAPPSFKFSVITERTADAQDALTTAITQALSTDAARFGTHLSDKITVVRVDQGAGIRSASQGVTLVYQIIGWGVLLLAGLGLLVAELIVVRQRMWFFGLARAIGARSRHIATLVLVDVLLVLATGTGLALLTLTLAEPAVAEFARQAFAVDAELIHPSTIPTIILGGLGILLLAGGLPAARATRHDPVDVLEAGRA